MIMEIKYKNIKLRDFLQSDIEDEIRWFTIQTAWMTADTPWEKIVPADTEELRREMQEFAKIKLQPNEIRSRLEVEVEGKHIGFVSCYMLDSDF